MTHQLDNAIERLVKETRAAAGLVWSRSGPVGEAIVHGGFPVTVHTGPEPCAVPVGAGTGATERDPVRLAAALPAVLLRELPAAPTAARTFGIGDDLHLTVVWCDPQASGDLHDEPQRHALAEVAEVAQLTRDLHFAEGEVERLRAAVNGLQDGVATLNPALNLAAVNQSAATLLGIAPGRNPLPAFDSALRSLADRTLNRAEVDHCISDLDADPSASIRCMWRFPTAPTHLLVVSQPVQDRRFQGRNWVFYDESESAQALESLKRAHAQLRASSDGMLDPQALLQAVRDTDGRIVDFVYRDVNRATCEYLGLAREALIGRTLLETMPNLEPSGLLAQYAECADTHQPMIIDDVVYDNEILAGPLHYDIRGNHVGGDFITLTWRDVTDRVDGLERIAKSESRFRLLAENVGDVVMHVRDGVIVWISPSVEETLGAPYPYWVGRNVVDIIADEDRNAYDKVNWLTDDRAVIPRGRVKAADGTRHWVHVHAKAFNDADGNPDGYTASFRLIDDEMRAMEHLEEARRKQAESDARFRNLMDNAAVGMGVFRPDGSLIEVNAAACKFFGYDAETLTTLTWQDLTAPEYLEADLENVEKMATGKIDSFRATKQFIHADGHLIWGDLSVGSLRKPNGDLDRMIGQVTDITMEVEARRFLARREEQNRILAKRLKAKSDRLTAELRSAAAYVESILPREISDGPVRVSSRYLPSTELGGDCFDYRWIDDDHLIVYILDVSGHGIEAAMVSISVHNLLRSDELLAANLLDPAAVLAKLNSVFTMERHSDNYLTAWYGVYERASRTLSYASAGHPPALLFRAGDGAADVTRLTTQGFPVGMFSDGEFLSGTTTVPPGSELLLYSDGAYELPTPSEATWSLEDFVYLSAHLARTPDWSLETMIEHLKARTDTGHLDDDCSLVRLTFD